MSPVPLAIAAPALLAGAAWLNAKAQLSYDCTLAYSLISSTVSLHKDEWYDRVNLFYTLEKYATTKSHARNTFLVYDGKEWTYGDVYGIVLKYGTWLKREHGIAPGEIVAMDLMNGPRFVFLWLALWSLGASPAFINYNLTGQALLYCIKVSTARIVLVDEEVSSQVTQEVSAELASPECRNGKGPVQVVFFDSILEQKILAIHGEREPDSSRAGAKMHQMAILIYTSGTTGLPKAAIVSWHKAAVGGMFTASWLGLKQSDRFYTVGLPDPALRGLRRIS